MAPQAKFIGTLVEYLDQGRLRPGLAIREQGENLVVLEAPGREKIVARDLVLIRHPERRAEAANLAAVLAELQQDRARLAAELDLDLLWGVVQEQGRSFTAAELAELFFGRRGSAATSVMLEALLNDRLYFVRRHLEFVARSPEQVERMRTQNEKIRQRSEDYRRTQGMIRAIVGNGQRPPPDDTRPLVDQLIRYLRNPSTRSADLTAMLTQAVPEVDPAETAFEILARLDAAPKAPRFAVIGGLALNFSEAAEREAQAARAGEHPRIEGQFAVSIDDEDTLEIDDALSCEPTPDGGLKVRIGIALVADFIGRGGAIDSEAAARAATVYLPEATIRMLPDEISCRRASLLAGEDRPALVTEVTLSAEGEVLASSIRAATIGVAARLDYDAADGFLANPDAAGPAASTVRMLHAMALKLRERRRRAGAAFFTRIESKVKVHDGRIEVKVVDNAAPSRQMVAEFMVLSNFVAARFASDNRIPIIYRVQPGFAGDTAMQKMRLSLYPEPHIGVGLDRYAQLSSPIRRYGDLVLQRQLVAALAGASGDLYSAEELLTVVAAMENTEAEGKELERRAKRYWILRYLEANQMRRPLKALATREGLGAELVEFGVRGSLRGAPSLATGTKVLVEIDRLDPLRGVLGLSYRGPDQEAADSAPR